MSVSAYCLRHPSLHTTPRRSANSYTRDFDRQSLDWMVIKRHEGKRIDQTELWRFVFGPSDISLPVNKFLQFGASQGMCFVMPSTMPPADLLNLADARDVFCPNLVKTAQKAAVDAVLHYATNYGIVHNDLHMGNFVFDEYWRHATVVDWDIDRMYELKTPPGFTVRLILRPRPCAPILTRFLPTFRKRRYWRSSGTILKSTLRTSLKLGSTTTNSTQGVHISGKVFVPLTFDKRRLHALRPG